MPSYRQVRDYFGTHHAASTLAAQIVSYWTNLGYHGVETWVEVAPITGHQTYAIRSNIHNGFPPKHPAKHMDVPRTIVPMDRSSIGDLQSGPSLTDTETFSQGFVPPVSSQADEAEGADDTGPCNSGLGSRQRETLEFSEPSLAGRL